MNRTLLPIRVVFLLVCCLGGWLVTFTVKEWDGYWLLGTVVGGLIGALTVLTDVLLKGFSLRGMSAVTFGLGVGTLVAWLIGSSPLLEYGEEQIVFLVRLALFLICGYLGMVLALRGADEFQLVIPYVRFVPHEVDVPLVVLDTSALIDGRIVRICEAHFLASALIVPEFVVRELHEMADAREPSRQARGRRGLSALNELRALPHVDLRVVESDASKGGGSEEKLVFLAQTMKAKLLTTDFPLTQRAQFHGVPCLNMNALSKALHTELQAGERVRVDLVKPGRDAGQAVGYLADGSMVVVENGAPQIGKSIEVEVTSILPSAGGKMIFARPVERR
ncbi:TRAM domain-containing protein [Opitutales bacterium ASA1]|uniref:PIN/TRAM domain-containing protein n=1 Tax=Congregicoccus parvus TaxID=3081749 RepID=UPI002B2B82CA|nr:TRAM domain-containing protein [Opitutales bacterium ASA1]